VISEFAGTFMFLLFAFGGTNAVNLAPADGQPADLSANPAKLQYIALCFGMSLAVNAWTFFRISGGLFNPAVTLGMVLIGASMLYPPCISCLSLGLS
jgi:aquaporin related protein